MQVIVGTVLSATSTLKVTSTKFPASSVTVKVISVVSEIIELAVGLCVISKSLSQSSVAVTSPV